MEFVTSIEKASEWGVTKRMVNYWCAMGKICGAEKEGIRWKIPMNAERPDRYGEGPALVDYVVRITGKKVGVGIQSFEEIRSTGAFYVDKTSFISQWWENEHDVTLITRPRRFGKTLNLSMIECFFSQKYAGREDLFDGLKIWENQMYHQLQGTYPVIFLSLAGIKEETYESAFRSLCFEIKYMVDNIKAGLDMKHFSEEERSQLARISWDMDENVAVKSLKLLTQLLYRYYGKKPIILLDEYDTPMQEAYFHGYWDRMAAFMRGFLNNTFKTNPLLEKALMTGITRIGRESMFSDMNHIDVATITTHKYETAFGFTQKEVFAALDHMGLGKYKKQVKQWYDGFMIGRCKDIYNPWSITKFIDSDGRFDTYWANTSSNTLINTMVARGSRHVKCNMEDLMNGKQIRAHVDETIDFSLLETDEDAIWGLLFTTGYLRADEIEEDLYTLSFTNIEIRKMFARMFRKWFYRRGSDFGDFQKALLAGNVEGMNYYMNMVAKKTFSYFDCGSGYGAIDETERFYHGFVLGLLAELSDCYHITSNRESGIGRYDIMMKAVDKQQNSYIIEFKVFNPEKDKDLSDCADKALRQIAEKSYVTELLAEGVDVANIRKYGFAFEGKSVLIKQGLSEQD